MTSQALCPNCLWRGAAALHRLTLFPLLIVLPFLTTTPAQGQGAGSSPLTVSARSHGVLLMLMVPGRVYPRHALVQVTVIVKNLSRVPISGPEHVGMNTDPEVEVLDSQNRVLYPPPFPTPAFPTSFKHPVPPSTAPGEVLVEHPFVVLHGDRLHAVLAFQSILGAGGPPQRLTVRTPVVHLTLVSAPRPTVTLHGRPRMSAVLQPATRHQRGALYHVGWFSCRLGNGQARYGGSGFYEDFPTPGPGPPLLVGYLYLWVPTSSKVLRPGCGAPLEWHVVAGWVNQSVVTIDYVKR